MSARRTGKRQLLTEYLATHAPALIDEAEWERIAAHLAPVSPRRLRQLLAEMEVTVVQPLAGVRQDSFEHLESSLGEIRVVYEQALAAGDRDKARQCRRVVIQSKDHARLAARNPRSTPQRRAEKQEMVDWMLVWLENPGVFAEWVRLRKRARSTGVPGPESGEPTAIPPY